MSQMSIKGCGLFAIAMILGPVNAQAHSLSTGYLSAVVQGERVNAQMAIPLKDLEYAVGLDTDGDGAITWGELRAANERVAAYALGRLRIDMGTEPISLRLDNLQVDDLSGGVYAVLSFLGQSGSEVGKKTPVTIRYALLFDINQQHRGLLSLKFLQDTQSAGYTAAGSVAETLLTGDSVTAVFGPEHQEQTFERALPGAWTQIRQFFDDGVWHIWTGYDHIAFLLVLLLPAVFIYEKGEWTPGRDFPAVFVNVLKIVSAFSIAHSLTLTAASLGLVHLPSRLVEAAIAASIVWGAVSNFYPRPVSRAWQAAFVFGLMHGFGFASVLQDLELTGGALLRALVAFNLGVESGQLAIVGIFLPLAYLLRSSWFYRKVVFVPSSGLIGLAGMAWLIERVFNVMLTSRIWKI